jgi:hypothetical protein
MDHRPPHAGITYKRFPAPTGSLTAQQVVEPAVTKDGNQCVFHSVVHGETVEEENVCAPVPFSLVTWLSCVALAPQHSLIRMMKDDV